jgi:hypothetical protein
MSGFYQAPPFRQSNLIAEERLTAPNKYYRKQLPRLNTYSTIAIIDNG